MKYILSFLLFFILTLSHGQSTKRVRFTPLPVVYYSPETRLGFGALVAANFQMGKNPDSLTRGSYAQSYFLYTINKQYEWGNLVRIYFPQNKSILHLKLHYTYFPEFYFGIETESPKEHKDTISYNKTTLDLRFYRSVNRNFYLGIAPRFSRITNIESGVGSFADDEPVGHDGYWILGIAPAFVIETRDNYNYPRKGFYFELLTYLYPNWNNRSHEFQSVYLDIRKYFPVEFISDIDVIALQFTTTVTIGDVPFKDMAEIGGSFMMRGYYTGFYRYKNLYALQAEFRTRIWKRLGLTTWFGAALTPRQWNTFDDNPVKPNAGVGLRIMMNRKDKLNVRLDQGFGKSQSGFYLDISEAF